MLHRWPLTFEMASPINRQCKSCIDRVRKRFRIAYANMLEKLGEKVPIPPSGKVLCHNRNVAKRHCIEVTVSPNTPASPILGRKAY